MVNEDVELKMLWGFESVKMFSGIICVPDRLFALEMPHLQDSFAEKLLEVMPRLSSCKPVELVKILQTTLRQSSLLQLALPEQVHIREPRSMLKSHIWR